MDGSCLQAWSFFLSQYSPTPKPRARMLGGCSLDEVRHAATDCVRLERTYRHDRSPVLPPLPTRLIRHVGTASAAAVHAAQVSDLRTTLWTSVFSCGVLLRSLSNQTPCSTCPGPVGLPALQGPARLQPTAPRQCHVLSNTARRTALRLATASCCRHAQAIPHSPGHTPALLSAELSPSWYAIPARNR